MLTTVVTETCSPTLSSSTDTINKETPSPGTNRKRGRPRKSAVDVTAPNLSPILDRGRPCRRTFPPILYDASQPSCLSSSKERKRSYKRHKKHRRHRSKGSRQDAEDIREKREQPAPVNPIFVWVAKEDTKIVDVVCKDYDLRNRIRLLRTANGWRAVPLTEKTPPQQPPPQSPPPPASSSSAPPSPLVTPQPDAFHNPSSSSGDDENHSHPASPVTIAPDQLPTTINDGCTTPKSQSKDLASVEVLAGPTSSPKPVDPRPSPPSTHPSNDDTFCETVDASRTSARVQQQVVDDATDAATESQVDGCGKQQVDTGDDQNDDDATATTAIEESVVSRANAPADEGTDTDTDALVIVEDSTERGKESATASDVAVNAVVVKSERCSDHIEPTSEHENDHRPVDGTKRRAAERTCPELEPVPIKLHSLITIKSESGDVERQQMVRRGPLCQTLKSSKLISRRSMLKNVRAHSPCKVAIASNVTVEKRAVPSGHVVAQNEPLDLGIGHREKAEGRQQSHQSSLAGRNSRLLHLLTSKNSQTSVVVAKEEDDPLQQLRNVLANPKYMVPDPLLVPKCRLSALVSSPGEEIPRLLSQNTSRDLSYFSILADPDVLVVSLSHLQSLLKKPINEEEILAYQKQTEEIRSHWRQQCKAFSTCNPYYWMAPDYGQQTPSIDTTRCYSSGCDTSLSKSSLVDKLQQVPKNNPLWQEFVALQQMSAAQIPHYSPFAGRKDDDNNNVCSAKDACNVIWNPEFSPSLHAPPSSCSQYKCCPDMGAAAARLHAGYERTPATDQLPFPLLPSVPYGAPPPYELGNPHLYDSYFGDLYHGTSPHAKMYPWDLPDSHYTLPQPQPTQAATAVESKSSKQPTSSTEEKKPSSAVVSEERENQPPAKEVKSEGGGSNRPLAPKIKVRKHLVDPNQHPPRLLLNQNTHHIFRPYPLLTDEAAATAGGPHLWHPLFNSSENGNYKKLQWITPPVTPTKSASMGP